MEWTLDPCDNMEESQKCSAEQKKPGMESTSCMIYSCETAVKKIDDDGKQTNSCLGLGVEMGINYEGTGRTLQWGGGGEEMSPN